MRVWEARVGAVKLQIIFWIRPRSISRPTSIASFAIPTPPPGRFEMAVKPLAPCRSRAAIRLDGVPGAAKPENMMVAPSGMSATASSKVP